PPPFFFRYDSDDLCAFYRCLVSQVGSGASILLANTPDSASPIGLETALELLETGHFAGIEDASGSQESFQCLQAAAMRHSFHLLVGSDKLFSEARRTR